MPAHNEGDRVYDMAREAVDFLEGFSRDHEIVIVDDGSTDNTHDAIARAQSEFKNIVSIALPENQGKGGALRQGFQASTY